MKNCSPLSNVHILPSEFCISVHNDSNCPILDNYDKNKKDFESGSICIPPIFLLKASTLASSLLIYFTNGTEYSRLDQVSFVEDSL